MKVRTLWFLIVLVVACTPRATPGPDTAVTNPPGDIMSTEEQVLNPFSPRPEDKNLTRGNVYLKEASLVIRESFPPQVSLTVQGDLPTPCHQLRADTGTPDAENRIEVDLYTVSDPNKVCAQVLEPFEASIDLGTFPTGHYTVWVNGKMAGEFDT